LNWWKKGQNWKGGGKEKTPSREEKSYSGHGDIARREGGGKKRPGIGKGTPVSRIKEDKRKRKKVDRILGEKREKEKGKKKKKTRKRGECDI